MSADAALLSQCVVVVTGRPQEAAVVKLPKALLQQHCQKLGWAPPRFDKLPLGGGRLPTASLRYSVTLEPAPQGKVPPLKLIYSLAVHSAEIPGCLRLDEQDLSIR